MLTKTNTAALAELDFFDLDYLLSRLESDVETISNWENEGCSHCNACAACADFNGRDFTFVERFLFIGDHGTELSDYEALLKEARIRHMAAESNYYAD